MNCNRFTRILADFEEGTLPAEERYAAEEHLEKCHTCRKLLEIVRGDVDVLPLDARFDLTRSILDSTSGSVCPRVESSLWDFAGSKLNPEESELIVLHLNHCPVCSSIASEMAAIQEVLPSMAEIEPGDSFTCDVIAVTNAHRPLGSDFRTRVQVWWNRMVQRPLFSFEAAYVATLFLFFAFSPLLPLRDIAVQKIPSVLEGAKAPASKHVQQFTSAVSWSNQALSESLEKTGRSVRSLLNRSFQDFEGWRSESAADLSAFWERFSHSVFPGQTLGTTK